MASITGTNGNDSLTGTVNDDVIYGLAGDDTIDGGNGNDIIVGGLGKDTMLGGAGNDEFLVGGTGIVVGEVIDGGGGSNKVSTYDGDLSLATITNVQTLGLFINKLKLSAAQLAGFSTVIAQTGTPATLTAANAGTYDLSTKTVTGIFNLTGSSGDDTLIGNAAAQTLDGGDGNDIIVGGLGADKLLGGANNDEFILNNGDVVAGESIDGGTGANKITAWGGDLSLATITNVQSLGVYTNALKLSATQMAGFSTLTALDGVSVTLSVANAGAYDLSGKTVTGTFNLAGSTGDDTLTGNAAAQTLDGGNGNDTITGGQGADILLGGQGNDTFLLNIGDVSAGEVIDGGTGANKITAWGGDLSPATITNVQTLELHQGGLKLSAAQLAAFSVLNALDGLPATLLAANAGKYDISNKNVTGVINLTGSAGNDTLIGNAAGQTLDGGDGNDILSGGLGADIMLGGAGNDEFQVGGAGIVAGEVIDGGSGANKLSTFDGDLSLATVTNVQTLGLYTNALKLSAAQLAGFSKLYAFTGAATLTAANAGTYDLSTKVVTGIINLTGSSGNDTLIGNAAVQTLSGGDGDDVLDGSDGNDIIIGGKGADIMLGGVGDDQFFARFGQATDPSEFEPGEVIDGGSGDNTLTAGGQLYLGTIQNIQHLIIDGVVNILASQLDQFSTIRKLAATPPGAEPPLAGVTAQSSGVYDFRGKINEDNFWLVANAPDSTLIGTDNKQTFIGSDGNQIFYGYGGDDLFRSSLGSDTIYGGDGNDRFENIGGSGVVKFYGEDGDDTFFTPSFTLPAGSIIDGGTGNNTLFASFSIIGTTLINIQTLKISASGLNLTADQFAQLSNGTIWQGYTNQQDINVRGFSAGTYDLRNIVHASRLASLIGSAGNDVLIGDADAQIIAGNGGDDVIDGQGGADTIYGYDGNDTIFGGGGADIMHGDVGDDIFQVNGGDVVAGEIIDGGSGDNTLKAGFAELHLATISNIQHLIIQDGVTLYASQLSQFSTIRRFDSTAAEAASYKTIYALSTGTYDFRGKIDQDNFVILAGVPGCTLIGSDTKQWFWGDFGDDVFYGYGGDDIFYGSTGTNIAYGGDGNDTFNLTVPAVNKFYGEGGDDIFNLPLGGMLPGSVIDGGSGSNTLVGNGSITDLTISNIQTLITDGFMLTADQLVQLSHGVVWQGQNNQSEIGISAASAGTYDLRGITHTARFSILFGSSGNDTLIGDADAQSIYGNNGDDIIDGQGGGDDAFGGIGSDTYRGSGMILHEDDSTIGNTDVLDLTNSAVAHDQLWFSQTGNDLDIFVLGRDHTIVKDWYLGNAHHVEQIKASDGLTLLDSQVQNLVNAMAGFAVPSTTTLSAEYHAALDPVLAANWA